MFVVIFNRITNKYFFTTKKTERESSEGNILWFFMYSSKPQKLCKNFFRSCGVQTMVFSEELFSRLLRELEVVLKYYWSRTQSLQQKIIDNFHLTNNQLNLTCKESNPVIH